MKLINIFEEVLNEGSSPILYHFTNTDRLNNILDTNSLYLTPNANPDRAEDTKGKGYFMSFTRSNSIRQGYGTKFRKEGSVRLKLDGIKLANNNKIIPLDYWQWPKDVSTMKNNPSGDEMEDRLVSNNDEIPNANKYIISIDIFVGEKGINSNIVNKLKELGIKVNYFDDINSFASGRPEKSVAPNIKDEEKDEEKDRSLYLDAIIGALTYKEPEISERVLNVLKTMVPTETYNRIIADIKGYHEKLNNYLRPNNDFWLSDIAAGLSADLHNNKTSSNKVVRFITKEFINDLKRNNVTSVKGYLKHKVYMGKNSQEDYNKQFNDKMNKLINDTIKKEIQEKYSFRVYDKEGNEIENLSMYPPVMNYIKNKVKIIKEHISNYILNNDDMFKYSYVLSSSELKKLVNLKDDSELTTILNAIDDISADEIKDPILALIWEIDRFYYDEVERMKEDNNNQWKTE